MKSGHPESMSLYRLTGDDSFEDYLDFRESLKKTSTTNDFDYEQFLRWRKAQMNNDSSDSDSFDDSFDEFLRFKLGQSQIAQSELVAQNAQSELVAQNAQSELVAQIVPTILTPSVPGPPGPPRGPLPTEARICACRDCYVLEDITI